MFQAARNGAVPGGVRDGDVRDGAAHDGYGATHDAARGGAVCGRGVRDGVAPASDGAEQLADEVTEAVAALSPAEGVASGHPDTPSPTAADSAATAGVVADFLPEERNGEQRFSATPVDGELPADKPSADGSSLRKQSRSVPSEESRSGGSGWDDESAESSDSESLPSLDPPDREVEFVGFGGSTIIGSIDGTHIITFGPLSNINI